MWRSCGVRFVPVLNLDRTREILASDTKISANFFVSKSIPDSDPDKRLAPPVAGLTFTTRESDRAKKDLFTRGIDPDRPWVCFANRSSSYLEDYHPGGDFSYHAFRDSSISNYYAAMNYFSDQGYSVIRMGRDKGPTVDRAAVATQDVRTWTCFSELTEMFLLAKCALFVSGSTGLDEVPRIFRRPIVYVNATNFRYLRRNNDLAWVIFKSVLKKQSGELLGLKGYLNLDMRNTQGFGQGFEDTLVIENSPSQILEISREALRWLLDTRPVPTPDYTVAQNHFWSVLSRAYGPYRKWPSLRIGTQCLSDLLATST
jgi:putative glycosyltransferase (TIGR04372 family)